MANRAANTVSSAGSIEEASDSGTLASKIVSIFAQRQSTQPEESTHPLEELAGLAPSTQRRPSVGEPQRSYS